MKKVTFFNQKNIISFVILGAFHPMYYIYILLLEVPGKSSFLTKAFFMLYFITVFYCILVGPIVRKQFVMDSNGLSKISYPFQELDEILNLCLTLGSFVYVFFIKLLF